MFVFLRAELLVAGQKIDSITNMGVVPRFVSYTYVYYDYILNKRRPSSESFDLFQLTTGQVPHFSK